MNSRFDRAENRRFQQRQAACCEKSIEISQETCVWGVKQGNQIKILRDQGAHDDTALLT